MLRNWYAVYTKSQREKKVSTILSKKGIEAYCPVNFVLREKANSRRGAYQPLFSSFVFVNISEAQVPFVKTIPGVISLVYWRAKPAVISDAEINAVKQITSGYVNIKLEKSAVDTTGAVQIIDEPIFSYNENSVRVKYHSLKVVLPSLGYTLIAEREWSNEEVVQPEFAQFSLFSKRLTSLFTN
ncbi:MAG: transcription termination/antitermination NusG family protein [Ferruginibacter sp.]